MFSSMNVYRSAKLYDLNHSGQVIYLEKVLNDTFDKDLRRIYIGDGDFRDRIFVGARDSENHIYYRDQQTVGYSIADRVQFGFSVHQSTEDTNVDDPVSNPGGWTLLGNAMKTKERDQYNYGIGFVIYVPATLQYNYPRFKALVDYHRVAGRQWKIQTF